MIRRVASTPSVPGMNRSMRITSGPSARVIATACSPSRAIHATSCPGTDSTTRRSTSQAMTESLTMPILMRISDRQFRTRPDVLALYQMPASFPPARAHFFYSTSRQRAKSTAATERIGHGGATHQTANLCSKLNCASLPRPQGRAVVPVPATGSGEPLGTDAEPGPSLSDGVRGPSHPPGGCSVTRPPSCCVTRPRAWSRTPILNRFASLLAGG